MKQWRTLLQNVRLKKKKQKHKQKNTNTKMKKLLTLIAFVLTTSVLSAQSTTLREVASKVQITKTDAAGADTIFITPSNARTFVKHTLTDSVTYRIKSMSQCAFGDQIIFMITNTSGGTKFKTIPASGFEVTGADSLMTITASKRAIQVFTFDGVKFIETSKIVQ